MTETLTRDIHVSIGQMRIGQPGQILRANIGSCVGIGMLWPQKNICILAHCLLPEGKELLPETPAKFVNFAVPEMIRKLGIEPRQRAHIEVVLGGGGNMFSHAVGGKTIGDMNVERAIAALREHRLYPAHTDTGGNYGRQIIIDCTQYSYSIRRIDHE
jgi:chemotaxis protein CheD